MVHNQAKKWFALHETNPSKEFCTNAIHAFQSSISAIGYGLMVSPSIYTKAGLIHNKDVAISDMSLIYGAKPGEIEKVVKMKKSMDEILDYPDTKKYKIEHEYDFGWLEQVMSLSSNKSIQLA